MKRILSIIVLLALSVTLFGDKVKMNKSVMVSPDNGEVLLSATKNADGTYAISALDAGPSWTTAKGVNNLPFTSADQSGAVASVTDAPANGKKLVITDCIISVNTAMAVSLKEETSGNLIYPTIYMAANSTVSIITHGKIKLSTINKKLQVQTSVSGSISVLPLYYSE